MVCGRDEEFAMMQIIGNIWRIHHIDVFNVPGYARLSGASVAPLNTGSFIMS